MLETLSACKRNANEPSAKERHLLDRQSNIVSFDDARRGVRERRLSSSRNANGSARASERRGAHARGDAGTRAGAASRYGASASRGATSRDLADSFGADFKEVGFGGLEIERALDRTASRIPFGHASSGASASRSASGSFGTERAGRTSVRRSAAIGSSSTGPSFDLQGSSRAAGLVSPRAASASVSAFSRDDSASRPARTGSARRGVSPAARRGSDSSRVSCGSFSEEEERRAELADAEEQAARRETAFSRLADKVSAAKRSRAKEKADRRFDKQYGGAQAASSDEPAGPRAAVYKGEMGSQHRKSMRMQDAPGNGPAGRSSKSARRGGLRLSKGVAASLVVTVCLVFSCAFLYTPAQQYYQELRERDRLQAEYDAVQQRNDAIQSEVDFLSTDAGIEDRAHEEFGWVKEDETSGSVTGLDADDGDDASGFTANIVPGSVKAPDTWYSGILDPLFGVS